MSLSAKKPDNTSGKKPRRTVGVSQKIYHSKKRGGRHYFLAARALTDLSKETPKSAQLKRNSKQTNNNDFKIFGEELIAKTRTKSFERRLLTKAVSVLKSSSEVKAARMLLTRVHQEIEKLKEKKNRLLEDPFEGNKITKHLKSIDEMLARKEATQSVLKEEIKTSQQELSEPVDRKETLAEFSHRLSSGRDLVTSIGGEVTKFVKYLRKYPEKQEAFGTISGGLDVTMDYFRNKLDVKEEELANIRKISLPTIKKVMRVKKLWDLKHASQNGTPPI